MMTGPGSGLGGTIFLTEKELRRLRRTELLELLVEQGRVVERLQKEVAELRSEAEKRQISIAKAGSIAEAYYSIDEEIRQETMSRLSPDLRSVVERWNAYLKDKHFS
jgi:hypothetical protein